LRDSATRTCPGKKTKGEPNSLLATRFQKLRTMKGDNPHPNSLSHANVNEMKEEGKKKTIPTLTMIGL